MPKFNSQEEAEAAAVPLRTLRPGAVFGLHYHLSDRIDTGVLIEHWPGASLVLVDTPRGARTIVTADGGEVEIPAGADRRRVTWSLETLVVPTGEVKPLAELAGKGAANMAKKTKKTVVKELLVTRYQLTAKIETEAGKKLLAKENKTHNGVLAQALNRLKEPATFEELFAEVDKRTYGSESKNVTNNMRWHLQDLRKKGFVKSNDHREEVTAPAPAVVATA